MEITNQPIGIFDSGIGGLTVYKQLRKNLPNEKLIYFGDTARIPYGTKSKQLIEQFALEDSLFLKHFAVKAIVVACNTASSLAIDYLKANIDIPVIGVVEPGALAAIKATKNKKVGIIGTSATIRSQAYEKVICRNITDIDCYSKDCPLLVPLVEEGWLDTKVTYDILHIYLDDILRKEIDVLVLGCTHYPLLKDSLSKVAGENVRLIDSGAETAHFVKETLANLNLLNKNHETYSDTFYVSDIPQKFEDIGSRFLGKTLKNVQRVDFEEFIISLRKSR